MLVVASVRGEFFLLFSQLIFFVQMGIFGVYWLDAIEGVKGDDFSFRSTIFLFHGSWIRNEWNLAMYESVLFFYMHHSIYFLRFHHVPYPRFDARIEKYTNFNIRAKVSRIEIKFRWTSETFVSL